MNSKNIHKGESAVQQKCSAASETLCASPFAKWTTVANLPMSNYACMRTGPTSNKPSLHFNFQLPTPLWPDKKITHQEWRSCCNDARATSHGPPSHRCSTGSSHKAHPGVAVKLCHYPHLPTMAHLVPWRSEMSEICPTATITITSKSFIDFWVYLCSRGCAIQHRKQLQWFVAGVANARARASNPTCTNKPIFVLLWSRRIYVLCPSYFCLAKILDTPTWG